MLALYSKSNRQMSRNTYSDEIAVRGSIAGWWAALLNVAILLLTVEIVSINRKNAANTQKMVGELEKINKTLTRVC